MLLLGPLPQAELVRGQLTHSYNSNEVWPVGAKRSRVVLIAIAIVSLGMDFKITEKLQGRGRGQEVQRARGLRGALAASRSSCVVCDSQKKVPSLRQDGRSGILCCSCLGPLEVTSGAGPVGAKHRQGPGSGVLGVPQTRAGQRPPSHFPGEGGPGFVPPFIPLFIHSLTNTTACLSASVRARPGLRAWEPLGGKIKASQAALPCLLQS